VYFVLCVAAAAAAMPDRGAKNTSAVQDGDLDTYSSNASAASLKNTSNNMHMLAMSQRSMDEFQRSGTSTSGTIVLSAQNMATSDHCSMKSDVSSCQLSDSDQLSIPSALGKANITNNAFLARLSKQSLQQYHQSSTLSLNGDTGAEAVLAVSTTFPAKPDAIMMDTFAATMATPQPVFRSPVPASLTSDDDVKAVRQPAKILNKPKDLPQTVQLSETLKPTATDTSRDRQSGTANVLNATDVTGKTTANHERPTPQSSSYNKQIKNKRAVAATQNAAASSVSQAMRRTDATDDEATKTKRVEITLPLDAFTLHETVKQMLGNKQEIRGFTLHKPAKQLLPNEQQTAGLGSTQKNTLQDVKMKVSPPSLRRTSDGDGRGASDTKQSAAASVEQQSKNKVVKLTSLATPSAVAQKDHVKSGFAQSSANQDKENTKTKLPTVSDTVPPYAEEKRMVIRVTVKPPEESENRENGVDVKPKKKIRFEVIEDLPSPINPDDHQIPSPSPSGHMRPNVVLLDQCSPSNAGDMLLPSPMPSDDELPVQLDSDEMMYLRRLFPMINSLVRVTLVPPCRKSHRRQKHKVMEDSDNISSTHSLLEVDDAASSEDSLSEENVDEETKSVEDTKEEASVQWLNRGTSVTKRPHPGPTRDKSAADVGDQFASLLRTKSEAKPKPDDVASLDISSLSSSTELPLDVETSSRRLSDLHVSMTQVPARILPPKQMRTDQRDSQNVPAQNSRDDAINNKSTKKDFTVVDEVTSQRDHLSSVNSANSISGYGHAIQFRHKPRSIQLGIASDEVEDILRQSPPFSTESLQGDIDNRATTIVSGIVQSLRITSSVAGY